MDCVYNITDRLYGRVSQAITK